MHQQARIVFPLGCGTAAVGAALVYASVRDGSGNRSGARPRSFHPPTADHLPARRTACLPACTALQEVQYNSDFQLVQMERRVARAEGHRSRDETAALTARIKELEGALEVGGWVGGWTEQRGWMRRRAVATSRT